MIDPETRQLRSHMHQIVEGGKTILKEQVKSEMHQSVVEVGTNICKNIKDAKAEVIYLRKMVAELAAQQGLKIAASGTHPFSLWQDQLIRIDVPSLALDLLVDDAELATRREGWSPNPPSYTSGVLGKYARLAQGAEKGAITNLV